MLDLLIGMVVLAMVAGAAATAGSTMLRSEREINALSIGSHDADMLTASLNTDVLLTGNEASRYSLGDIAPTCASLAGSSNVLTLTIPSGNQRTHVIEYRLSSYVEPTLVRTVCDVNGVEVSAVVQSTLADALSTGPRPAIAELIPAVSPAAVAAARVTLTDSAGRTFAVTAFPRKLDRPGERVPPLRGLSDHLLIATGSGGGAALRISNAELGASRSVISGGLGSSIIEATATNVMPLVCYEVGTPLAGCEAASQDGPTSKLSQAVRMSLVGTFMPVDAEPSNASKNRWIIDSSTAAESELPDVLIPYATSTPTCQPGSSARLRRSMDWSGDVAVTSTDSGASLSNVNIFAKHGVELAGAPANTVASDSSYFFADRTMMGSLMSESRGVRSASDLADLETNLREWRSYLRELPAEMTVDENIVNQSRTEGVEPRVNCFSDTLDTNEDGLVIVDVGVSGDFVVSNSDWILDGSGTKRVVFRLRGSTRMLVSNSSIVVGEKMAESDVIMGAPVLFVHVHPDELFSSEVGSSVATVQVSSSILGHLAIWDLTTIGAAATDTDFGGVVDRPAQTAYTSIALNNVQGCVQIVGPNIALSNGRLSNCASF